MFYNVYINTKIWIFYNSSNSKSDLIKPFKTYKKNEERALFMIENTNINTATLIF